MDVMTHWTPLVVKEGRQTVESTKKDKVTQPRQKRKSKSLVSVYGVFACLFHGFFSTPLFRQEDDSIPNTGNTTTAAATQKANDNRRKAKFHSQLMAA